MTYLQYNQINTGEGETVDLEQDLARAKWRAQIACQNIRSQTGLSSLGIMAQ